MKTNRKGQIALESMMIITFILISISLLYGALSMGSFSVDALYTTRIEAQNLATKMSLGVGNQANVKQGYSAVIKVDITKENKVYVVAVSENCDFFTDDLKRRVIHELPSFSSDDVLVRCDVPYQYTYCDEKGVCS